MIPRKEEDLLFLDIEMGNDSMGGMSLARHIGGVKRGKQPIVISVIGYEKYVFDAFDVGAFQYLVEPVNKKKFAEVFGRAVKEILSKEEQLGKKLALQFGGEKKAILLIDIYYKGMFFM